MNTAEATFNVYGILMFVLIIAFPMVLTIKAIAWIANSARKSYIKVTKP